MMYSSSLSRGLFASATRASPAARNSLQSALAVSPNSLNLIAASSRQQRQQQQHVSTRTFSTSSLRWAANPQAGKPTSENVSHMVKNIKEEAGQVAASLTNSIAGRAGSGAGKRSGGGESEGAEGLISGTQEILADVKGVTAEMTRAMPQPALVWGAAGVIPYVTTAGASIYLARQAWLVGNGIDTHLDLDTAQALLLHAQNIQVSYGAIMLSFLGAIHWGFEFSKFGGTVGNRRYVLGLVPVALAWPTLLLNPSLALVSQWATFVTIWFIDLKATNAGWAPKWYSTYRFWLTFFVGTSIIATLAGTRYYSNDTATSGQRSASAKLLQSKLESHEKGDKVEAKVGGDIEATPAGEEGDSFVKLTNLKKQKEEEEARKKKEQEKEKKSVKQEEKLSKQMEKADSKDA
ncbi:hypothetical protein CF319_g2505 [Tilletia indica]|nr:hypothetical protein CF319_g2505 [Tilletia indica]KAE8228363.1 hypothetical protein CF326_g6708 [Tilletia indica]